MENEGAYDQVITIMLFVREVILDTMSLYASSSTYNRTCPYFSETKVIFNHMFLVEKYLNIASDLVAGINFILGKIARCLWPQVKSSRETSSKDQNLNTVEYLDSPDIEALSSMISNTSNSRSRDRKRIKRTKRDVTAEEQEEKKRV